MEPKKPSIWGLVGVLTIFVLLVTFFPADAGGRRATNPRFDPGAARKTANLSDLTATPSAVVNLTGFPAGEAIAGASGTNHSIASGVHGVPAGSAFLIGSGTSQTIEGASSILTVNSTNNGLYSRVGVKSLASKSFFIEQQGSTAGGTLLGYAIAHLAQLYYDGTSALFIRSAASAPIVLIVNGVVAADFATNGIASFVGNIKFNSGADTVASTALVTQLRADAQASDAANLKQATASTTYLAQSSASATYVTHAQGVASFAVGAVQIQGATQVASAGATADNQFRNINASGSIRVGTGNQILMGLATGAAAIEISTTSYQLRLRSNANTHVNFDSDSAGNAVFNSSGTGGVAGAFIFQSGEVEKYRCDGNGNGSYTGSISAGGGPGLKTKKLTLNTATTAGGVTAVAHGLASATIRSIECLVIASGIPAIVPPETSNGEGAAADTMRYSVYEYNNNINIQLTNALSAGVIGCSATVVLTYEP